MAKIQIFQEESNRFFNLLTDFGGSQPCKHKRAHFEGIRTFHPREEHHMFDKVGSQPGFGSDL
jgi:hypothetical protein